MKGLGFAKVVWITAIFIVVFGLTPIVSASIDTMQKSEWSLVFTNVNNEHTVQLDSEVSVCENGGALCWANPDHPIRATVVKSLLGGCIRLGANGTPPEKCGGVPSGDQWISGFTIWESEIQEFRPYPTGIANVVRSTTAVSFEVVFRNPAGIDRDVQSDIFITGPSGFAEVYARFVQVHANSEVNSNSVLFTPIVSGIYVIRVRIGENEYPDVGSIEINIPATNTPTATATSTDVPTNTPTATATSTDVPTSTPTATVTPIGEDVWANPVTSPNWIYDYVSWTGTVQWFACPNEATDLCVRWATNHDGLDGLNPRPMTLAIEQDGDSPCGQPIPAGRTCDVYGITLRRVELPQTIWEIFFPVIEKHHTQPTSTPTPTSTLTSTMTPTPTPTPKTVIIRETWTPTPQP